MQICAVKKVQKSQVKNCDSFVRVTCFYFPSTVTDNNGKFPPHLITPVLVIFIGNFRYHNILISSRAEQNLGVNCWINNTSGLWWSLRHNSNESTMKMKGS